jgi:hypothetical protein
VLLLSFSFPQVPNYDSRPPHRWWCIGPERSGTGLHCDPLATSAWNSVTDGVKYWVLYPPGTNKETAKGIGTCACMRCVLWHIYMFIHCYVLCVRVFIIIVGLRQKGEDKEAITWYTKVFPRIKKGLIDNNDQCTEVYEFLQYPGETVYVPGGWWHAVVNLTDTVAVTQNFCTCETFERVWRQVRKGRNHMARRWLLSMYESKDGQIHPRSRYPSPSYRKLALLATEINKQDGFVWKFGKRKKNARYPEPVLPPELRYEGDGLPPFDPQAAERAKRGYRAALEKKLSRPRSKAAKKPMPARTQQAPHSASKLAQPLRPTPPDHKKPNTSAPSKVQFKLSNGYRNFAEAKAKHREDNREGNSRGGTSGSSNGLYKSYVTNNAKFRGLKIKQSSHVFFADEGEGDGDIRVSTTYGHISIS